MSNLCRSPLAAAVLQRQLQQRGLQHSISVDSAGTHTHPAGAAPDARTQALALRRGYDLSAHRSRAVRASDYPTFDWLLCMDWDTRALLEGDAPPACHPKIRGLAEFLQTSSSPLIPDPWDGGPHKFDEVLDLLEEACSGLLQRVPSNLIHHV